MSIYFPHVQIPYHLEIALGDFDEKTRSYNQRGEERHIKYWYDAIAETLGGVVSPAGVLMYVPVTRAAIRKRMMSGGFTVFNFHSEPSTEGLFRNKKENRDSAYTYVPVSECESWAAEIQEKMIRLGKITREETLSDKPDWATAFEHFRDEDEPWERKLQHEVNFTKHLENIGAIKTKKQQMEAIVEQWEAEGLETSGLKELLGIK